MGRKNDIPRLSTGELELIQMLWREDGVTILEAQQALGLPIGYTTVQTRLNRLVKKGVAEKSKSRPAKYTAKVTPDDVRRTDLDMLVTRVCGGKFVPLVAHLVNDNSVTREELAELKQLVRDVEQRWRKEREHG